MGPNCSWGIFPQLFCAKKTSQKERFRSLSKNKEVIKYHL
jgi:hypothetical protein